MSVIVPTTASGAAVLKSTGALSVIVSTTASGTAVSRFPPTAPVTVFKTLFSDTNFVGFSTGTAAVASCTGLCTGNSGISRLFRGIKAITAFTTSCVIDSDIFGSTTPTPVLSTLFLTTSVNFVFIPNIFTSY